MDMLLFFSLLQHCIYGSGRAMKGAALSPLMLLKFCNMQLSLSIFICKCTKNGEVLTPISPGRSYKIR